MLIFIKFLITSFDLFLIYLCIEGITYILYLILIIALTNNIYFFDQKYKNIFIKYFIFNSVSSLFLLFSLSLLFSITGNLSLNFLYLFFKYYFKIFCITYYNYLFILIFVLFCIGFFFKLLIFPFFFWAHDFYENLPIYLFIFLSTIYKFIIFSIFFFLLKLVFFIIYKFAFLFLFIGILTFICGFIGAFFTAKIRVFLFYTSINQIGLCLIAISQFLLTQLNFSFLITIFFYFYFYIITLFFFLLTIYSIFFFKRQLQTIEYFNQLYFIKYTNFLNTLILSGFLFSFAGIPPFIGFFLKYELFRYLFLSNFLICVFCIICSLFSAFYYLSVINTMFFNKKINKFQLYYIKKFTINLQFQFLNFLNIFFLLFSFFYVIFADWDFYIKQGIIKLLIFFF
jgi:NADH:ubiquinone oxidoreductase subunit 2 (subunit N)